MDVVGTAAQEAQPMIRGALVQLVVACRALGLCPQATAELPRGGCLKYDR